MKVLIVNVNAYSGSTGKITKELYDYLIQAGHEVLVCYRGIKEEHINNPSFIPIISKYEFKPSVLLARLTGLESHFSFIATRKLKSVVRVFKPDIVQLYNIHGNYFRAYSFLQYLKNQNLPVVYSMLDEFAYMGKCPYPAECERFKTECCNCPQKGAFPESWFFDMSKYLFHKKERCYKDFQRLVFTGPPFVVTRAKESYLLRERDVRVLLEPFNFDEFYYPRETKALRAELGINKDDKVIVCASGTTQRKGGKYFVEVAKKLQNEHTIKLIFIGYNRNDWDFPQSIIVKGYITDQNELADYLSLADAYVCTSIGDSTPSVCLAALGCGTPLIGFEYGGVMDCAPQEFGTYVPIGDIDSLARAILECKKKTPEDVTATRNFAINRFSALSIFTKQENLYKELLVV